MFWIREVLQSLWTWCLAPLAMLLFTIGCSVLLVASPVVWSRLYEAPEHLSEYAQQDGQLIAQNLWTDVPYGEVSDKLKGGRLIEKEVIHYEDLQAKFEQLLVLVAVCFCMVVLTLLFQKHNSRKVVYLSLGWLLLIVIIGSCWSVYNWRQMFRALHWWIFQDDSWVLPWSSYSLKLFPYAVWKKSMVFVAVTSVSAYLFFLWLSGRRAQHST